MMLCQLNLFNPFHIMGNLYITINAHHWLGIKHKHGEIETSKYNMIRITKMCNIGMVQKVRRQDRDDLMHVLQ